MALEVAIKRMTLNFTREKKSKYVASANRGRVVEPEKLIEQIRLYSGLNRVQIQGVISTLVESMNVYLSAGHGVRLEGFGTFLPSVVSRSADVPDAAGVRRVKVTFIPSKSLRRTMMSIPISTNNGGGTPKSNTQETSPSAPGKEAGRGGTSSGGGTELD